MAVMEGSLSKWTNVMKGWQYRWFVLDENSGLLSYYTSKEKMMRGVRRGCVRLKGAIIGIDDEDDSTFTITVDHKTFHFQARDGDEREKWVRALEDTIFRHGTRVRWDNCGVQPTIKDFDNKVSEADAYLQLMIEQTNKLESRIQDIDDVDEKQNYQAIFENANTMLDDIKHSIVLLQIAKNTAHPINGLYPLINNIQSTNNPSYPANPNVYSVPETSYSSSEGEDDFFDANDSPFNTGSQVPTPTSLRQFTDQGSGGGVGGAAQTLPVSAQIQAQQQQHVAVRSGQGGVGGGSGAEDAVLYGAAAKGVFGSAAAVAAASRSLELTEMDYDTLYEDDVEADVHIDAQGSVIKHLLSQVKIGMDLTKVVLPTFILERRSLLEMYADYFAHPDLFVTIADLPTPRDRFVQVLRWYLSSYHAGRKSAVAKKPYNPILGETFCCHWDIPGGPDAPTAPDDTAPQPRARTSTTGSSGSGGVMGGGVGGPAPSPTITDGPVPWCRPEQLSFVAEQVSHHPPISAFYAEHHHKRISFNAHIYTKSKFLGLSICVYNVGQGVVHLIDHDEQYIVTFPNGYGRSILTVPWIELGGTVTVRCPQTGYHGTIEFQLKPFYGNKKHRIVAELFAPEEGKRPFFTVTGEWNGVMEGKWADRETEEFINVNKLNIVKKQVRPISQQGDSESRRMWKDVTLGLKLNNIEGATKAKASLEQKQREAAKERKDRNIEWETKLFMKAADDQWMYINPLQQRLSNSQASKP